MTDTDTDVYTSDKELKDDQIKVYADSIVMYNKNGQEYRRPKQALYRSVKKLSNKKFELVHLSGLKQDNIEVTLIMEEGLPVYSGLPKAFQREMESFRNYDRKRYPYVCLSIMI